MESSEPNEGVVRRADLLDALDAVQAAVHRLVLAVERGSPKAPMESSTTEKSPTEAMPLNASIEEDTSIGLSADLLPLFAEVDDAVDRKRPTQEIIPTAEANNEDQPRSEENSGFAERRVEFKDRRGGFGLDALPLNAANHETTIVPSADLLPLLAYDEVEGTANRKRPTREIVPTAEMDNEAQPRSEENSGFAARLVELKSRRGGFWPG
jgi:hypothetical protein